MRYGNGNRDFSIFSIFFGESLFLAPPCSRFRQSVVSTLKFIGESERFFFIFSLRFSRIAK